MARDKNDARVTFVAVAGSFGLTAEQTKTLWRCIHPRHPIAAELTVAADQ